MRKNYEYAITEERAQEFIDLFNDRSIPLADIAEHFGISSSTVQITARRFGLNRQYKQGCAACGSLAWCRQHIYADKLPCELEPTPYLPPARHKSHSTFLSNGVVHNERS